MSVVADAVTAANVIAKLPFFAELDPDAVLTTFREKQLAASSELTAEGLQALFYGERATPSQLRLPSRWYATF